ncbi:MAG: hypothetical protein WCF67_06430 [Chitinophagaceae bacterium]
MNISDLEKILLDAGFPKLFMYGERSLSGEIWNDQKNEDLLKKLLASDTASDHARFLAAEVLRVHGAFFNEPGAGKLAEIYAGALKNTSEGSGNPYQLSGNLWGFLYESDDAGPLGEQLINSGKAAIPVLINLLNDDNPVLYEGSQEATLGNEYQYRIKDFAAFYISKIKNIPVKFYQDINDRDKEIERLKNIMINT